MDFFATNSPDLFGFQTFINQEVNQKNKHT
jgi:hypothetical protein